MTLPLYSYGRKQENRIFNGSFLDETIRIKEPPAFVMDFSGECAAERTVCDFLMALGLSFAHSGTKYVMHILMTAVNTRACVERTSDAYKIAADRYKISLKTVEMSIARAMESITTGRIERVNCVFGSEVLGKERLCAGAFLCAACRRFAMLSSHAAGKLIFSDEN